MPANRVVSNPSVMYDGRHTSMLPEQRLWGAVILQAIRDMQWVDPNPNGPPNEGLTNGMRRLDWVRIRDEALVWLIYDEVGFPRACELAGLDPDYMRRKIRKLVEASDGASALGDIFDT